MTSQELEETVTFLLEIGESPLSTSLDLLRIAAEDPPELFMHLVPNDIRHEMMKVCDIPPANIDDHLVCIQSSNCLAGGRTDEELGRMLEEHTAAWKQRLLDGMVAMNHYFKSF